jgi:hypothetical protein
MPQYDTPMTEKETHKLFHKGCSDCDDPSLGGLVNLCGFCRQLRPRHLMRCWREKVPERFISDHGHEPIVIMFQPGRKDSDPYDLCQYLVLLRDQCGTGIGNSKMDRFREHKLTVRNSGHCIWESETKAAITKARLCVELPGKSGRQRVGTYVNWQWLRNWLHDLSKDSSGRSNDKYRGLQIQQTLCDVCVIDVSNACVAYLPTRAEFVALSYVWESTHDDQFRCLKSDISRIEQPRSLEEIMLPATIRDAIMVCKQLGQQFLWVDRLCIVQDEAQDALSRQLNQMAAIYHQAALTLVAATGDDATKGLPGVSYARDSKQHSICFDDGFKLVSCTIALDEWLEESKWKKRAWTYQEYLASKRLLFFGEYGLFVKTGFGLGSKTYAEGAAQRTHFRDEKVGLELVEVIGEKELTHSSDILRASSGILHAVYGNRMSFGMPWDEFDAAILWMPTAWDHTLRQSTQMDHFPTWSWASSSSCVEFELQRKPVYSLAYWGRRTANGTATEGQYSWPTIPS